MPTATTIRCAPTRARLIDYWLGGKDHYATDRVAAEQMTASAPWLPAALRASHDAALDAVDRLARAGVDQFLAIECGYPTHLPIAATARRHTLRPRTIYLDDDPIVLAHVRAMHPDPDTLALPGSIGEIAAVLVDPTLRDHLDGDRPLAALITTAPLHLNDRPFAEALIHLQAGLPSGSHIVLPEFGHPVEGGSAAAEPGRFSSTAPVPRTTATVSSPSSTGQSSHAADASPTTTLGDAAGAIAFAIAAELGHLEVRQVLGEPTTRSADTCSWMLNLLPPRRSWVLQNRRRRLSAITTSSAPIRMLP